jgi:CBS domain-containing protein
MAAIMGGTMRAPFMATLFALETTHAWGLLPPIFIGCVAATAFTVIFVPRSILTEKLARRGMHVAREYSVHPLELVAVGAAMVSRAQLVTLDAGSTVAEIARRFAQLDAQLHYREYPVVTADGTLVGFVSHSAVLGRAQSPESGEEPIAACCEPALTIHEDARVRTAANVMAQSGRRSLAVIDENGVWAGVITVADLLRAWKDGLSAETKRVRVRSLSRSALFSRRT